MSFSSERKTFTLILQLYNSEIMKRLLSYILLSAALLGCYNKKTHYPNEEYHYAVVDTTRFTIKKMVYVPVYSNIYDRDGSRTAPLAVTLSVRSMNFRDSIYITKVDYYNSQGKVIKKYIDSTLLLKPMQSVEFVVGITENEGGAGANFIVEWGAIKAENVPLIQMMGYYDERSVSFLTEGTTLEQ